MESLCGFVIIVFLLIFLVSTVYARFVSSPYKRNENADFGEMDIETLKKLLKERLEYPYCKNISINEEGDIDLVCKYAAYVVKIEDRKLVINNKFRPFAKAGNIEEEKDCLEAHLVKILLPDAAINTPRALGHFRRYIKARILSKISGWFLLILFILYALNSEGIHITDVMDIWTSKGVSMMRFAEYSEEITIGEALRAAYPAGKWSSNKIDKGLYRVAFDGYGMNGRLLTIVFQSKDWSECSILSIAMDGQDCSPLEGMLLEVLFANAEDGDGGGQIDGQGLLDATDEYIEEDGFLTDDMEVTGEESMNLSEQSDDNADDLETYSEVDESYDSEVQGKLDETIPVWELSGHYGGIIGGQSFMDFSVYTDESGDGCVGSVDIYVEGGQYSYQAYVYEVSSNLYWVDTGTDEEVVLLAYRDGEDIIVQLYVDGECITEYLLVSQFQS